MNYTVYGTVYNNVDTIETTIQSIFSPEYEIIITDAFSSDGTYEKLREIKKEYNITLFRFASKRGLGRNYSLIHCKPGSRTAYIDFDITYNANFHQLMLNDAERLLVVGSQRTFFINRETLLRCGGWKNLNQFEDIEMTARIKPLTTVPAIIGKISFVRYKDRERRYKPAQIDFDKRKLINNIDTIRALGIKSSEVMQRYKKTYNMAKNYGIYKYDRHMNNLYFNHKLILETLVDPEKFGIRKELIALQIWESPNFIMPKTEERRKIEEVLGPIDEYYFRVKPDDGIMHVMDKGVKRAVFVKKGVKIRNWIFNYSMNNSELIDKYPNYSTPIK